MTFNPIRPLAVAAMFALATPASAVVVAHDAQGAYLSVTKDAYLGGKYNFPVAARAPVPAPLTAVPSAPAVPAIDPVVVIAALAVLLAIVLLSNGGDSDGESNVSDMLMPEPPETDTPFTPPFEDPPRQENRPRPDVPAVPLPPALLLLLSGIGGLAWAGRRKA